MRDRRGAVDAPADVLDNRPLSGRFIGRSLFRETGQQLVRSLARLVARHLGVSLRTVLPVTGGYSLPLRRCAGVIAMARGAVPTLIVFPAVPVAIRIGVTVSEGALNGPMSVT